MFPNWIWYILGKKSSGDSPTPPEPPTPVETPVVLPNGIKFGGSTWITLPDFIKKGDFSDVTTMKEMCNQNSYLTEFVLSDETSQTTKNCINCGSMFSYCGQLKKVGLFDTSNVTDFSYMFSYCYYLEDNIPLFNTSKVTTFYSCFRDCRKITKIPQFDTSKNQNFNNCFVNCYALTDLPLLDSSEVINFGNMFSGTNNLSDTSLDNILQMCINATNYSGTKTLSTLSLSSGYDSRIVNLPHYQDFLDSGWIIR